MEQKNGTETTTSAQHAQRPRKRGGRSPAEIPHHKVEKFRNRALLDHEAAIHVGFAQSELGVEENVPFGGPAGKADRDRRARAITAAKARSCRGRDPKIPHADQPLAGRPKQPIHRPPPSRHMLRLARDAAHILPLPPRTQGPGRSQACEAYELKQTLWGLATRLHRSRRENKASVRSARPHPLLAKKWQQKIG